MLVIDFESLEESSGECSTPKRLLELLSWLDTSVVCFVSSCLDLLLEPDLSLEHELSLEPDLSLEPELFLEPELALLFALALLLALHAEIPVSLPDGWFWTGYWGEQSTVVPEMLSSSDDEDKLDHSCVVGSWVEVFVCLFLMNSPISLSTRLIFAWILNALYAISRVMLGHLSENMLFVTGMPKRMRPNRQSSCLCAIRSPSLFRNRPPLTISLCEFCIDPSMRIRDFLIAPKMSLLFCR